MLSCSIRFSAPSFWMGGGLDSRCACRVCTVHTNHAVTLKTTTHLQTRCRKPYAATQHLMLLIMGVCTRNMSSKEYINKITLLHQVGNSNYFMRKMHGQTTLKRDRSSILGRGKGLFKYVSFRFLVHLTSYSTSNRRRGCFPRA